MDKLGLGRPGLYYYPPSRLEEVSVHGPLGGFYYNPTAEGRCGEGVSWQKLKLTFPIHGMKKNLAPRTNFSKFFEFF